MKIRTKYSGLLEWTKYQEQLVANIFKLLPLMDEKRNWKRYLRGLLIELAGLDQLTDEIEFTSLNGKLEGLFLLSSEDIKNGEFKKIVFDSIGLAKKIQIK